MLTLCEELDAALAGGGVDVVLEAAALGLPAGGVVGEVLPLLARARGLLHTPKLVSHHIMQVVVVVGTCSKHWSSGAQ